MTQWPALGPPTRTLITCCPFCRAWRFVWSVAWPLPSDPYWVPMIVLRVLIWVFLLSFGVVVISILSHKVTCGQVSGFLLPRVTRVQHLRRRVLRGTTVTRLRLRHPPPIGRSVHPVRLVLAVATPSSRGSTSLVRFHPVGPHILLQLVVAGSFDLMIATSRYRIVPEPIGRVG